MPKPKKWAAYKGIIPAFENEDKKFVQKVDEFKKLELTDKNNKEIALLQDEWDNEKDKLEEQIKLLNIKIAATESLLAERFEQQGIQSTKFDFGNNYTPLFYIKDEPYTKIINKKECIQWLKDNGLDDMNSPVWQSLNALVKERMANGEELPKGIEVFLKTTVVKRKN